MSNERLKCQMQLYLDGVHVGASEHLQIVPPDDVEAMAVYTSAEVPIEYGAIGSACRVMRVWTR